MAEILARCGYRCDLCPAYCGNIKSEADRQKVSDGWFKYGGFRVKPEEINCQGCTDGNKTLDSACPVLPCVKSKNIRNCGYCPEMPCENLKTRMNFFENRLGETSDIPADDFNIFIKPYLSKGVLLEIQAQAKKG
jgi:hypothetical protein